MMFGFYTSVDPKQDLLAEGVESAQKPVEEKKTSDTTK
jgi:hypothetical protein